MDIAPVSYADTLTPFAEAMRGADVMAAASRAEVQSRLQQTAIDPGVVPFLMQNLVMRNEHFDWRINLMGIAAAMPQLCSFPTDLLGARFDRSLTVIAGANSEYVAQIDGEAYVAEMDGPYAIPPGQLRYHAKLEDGEPLFVLFGTALGAPGRMYVLVTTDVEDGGCGFIRLNLRDRWMRTYRKGEVWELIDRTSVTYENGAFEYLKMALEDEPTPSNPAHVYTLRHESFRCSGQVGLHRAVHMSEDGRGLKSYGFTGSDGEPSWGEVTGERLVPLQRFFCGNGADSRIATHFADAAAVLAAWRAENEN